MEQTIAWPAHYLGRHFPQLLRPVQVCAFARSRDRNNHWVARKLLRLAKLCSIGLRSGL
jgi:hypothetical protein